VINHDVYLDSFSATAQGGNGDYDYGIDFVEAKGITVYTVNELGLKPAAPTNNNVSTNTRPAPPQPKTYTVKSGDTLWAIAKKYLGAGNRYSEIYSANKSVIGSNPNLIKPGQVLTIPS
jgi:nucleoid-associated protein YgaU